MLGVSILSTGCIATLVITAHIFFLIFVGRFLVNVTLLLIFLLSFVMSILVHQELIFLATLLREIVVFIRIGLIANWPALFLALFGTLSADAAQ